MKSVNFSEQRMDKLPHLWVPNSVLNTEAKMLECEIRGKRKVIKRLYHSEGAFFENKIYTVQELDKNKQYLPDNLIIPDALVTVDKRVVGYSIPYSEGVSFPVAFRYCDLSLEEQKFYLKK